MLFPGEREAIDLVTVAGAKYGYGNLIDHLQRAWSKLIQEKEGLSKQTADMAAGIICVYCRTDSRTGKKLDG